MKEKENKTIQYLREKRISLGASFSSVKSFFKQKGRGIHFLMICYRENIFFLFFWVVKNVGRHDSRKHFDFDWKTDNSKAKGL
jgi:hypothetical protein